MMKITLAILGIFVLCMLGCSEEPFQCNCDTSAVAKNDSVINSQLKDTASYNSYLRYWKIPPLSNYKNECYRFKADHAFASHTQIYTVIENASEARMVVQQYNNSLSDRKNSVLDMEYEILLTKKEWREIKQSIKSKCFWSNAMSSRSRVGLDGGSWFLEGYDPDKRNCANSEYHMDDCYYGDTNEFGQICRIIKKYAKEKRLNVYPD